MALSNNLISQFVKVTDDTDKSKKEKSTYGTVKEYNGEKYVQIDGSNMLTPYFSTTIVKDGDRVVVDLKDHNAVVSGNITSPATRSDDFNSEVTNTAENFKATNASIDALKVKQGQFEELATEKLNAAEANIDVLAAREANFESVTTENFATTNASIENLSGDFANFKVTTTDSLTANEANITKVSGDLADFITVTTDTFKSTDAEITNLKTAKADIDLANIDVANIGILFNKVGLIDRATIVDGHITGFLDAVEINANNITAGTLIADRILLTGSQNGLLYQLNNLGELTSTNVDTLDGSILTERTVTADKLVAKSITTNELDVDNIFGNSAVLSTLVSQEAFINAISSNTVVVGASQDAASALSKASSAATNAENALTKANQSIKGITYHYLATSASSGVTTSTSGWTTTVQAMTITNKYLWTYQTMTDTSGKTSNTTPVISGVYGDKGLQGPKGDTGATGPQGIQGEKGDTGAQGPKGDKGATGPQGIQGEKGDTGAQGPKGDTGAQGPKGDTGAQGPKGDKGAKGDKGLQGPKGDTGATGTSITQAIPLYYASNSTTAPSAPTSAVTSTSTGTKVWTTVQPAFNNSYPYIYTCTQVKYSTNTYTWSTVTIDRTLSNMAQWCSASDVTLIDGSKIYTGSITANELDVNNIFGNSAVLTTLTSQEAFINAISTNSVVVGASNAANSALSTANSASSNASTALNTVNNMEIGGRNLFVLKDCASAYESGGSFIFSTQSYQFMITYVEIVNNTKLTYQVWNPNEITNYSNTNRVAFYNSEKTYLSSITLPALNGTKYQSYTMAIPSNAKYLRLGAIFGSDNGVKDDSIKIKFEFGNKATDWTPAPEDISVENIYTPNTTTIDGGKITTGSITAQRIDVKDLFAQHITATGTITGARLYGTYIEANNGEIGGWDIYNRYLQCHGIENATNILGYLQVPSKTTDYVYSVLEKRSDGTYPNFYVLADGTVYGKKYTHIDTESIVSEGQMQAVGDVIAGWGTDNPVSLQTLNSNLAFKFHGRMSNLNFNTYQGASYAGIWLNGGTNQSGTSNAPSTADNGYLFVFVLDEYQTKTIHIWVGIYKGIIQGRYYNGSSWTSWKTISSLR